MGLPNRITSDDLVIRWLPLAETDADTHVSALRFDSAVSGGTFKLWVNGEETAAITISGTPATDIASINTALDNTAVLGAGEIVCAGTWPNLTLTANGAGFYRIELVYGFQDTLTQGTPNNNTKAVLSVTTQGSEWYELSAHASSFSWEGSTNVVDVSAFADKETIELPTRSSVSFDMSMFRANEEWFFTVYEGAWGLLEVYPQGQVVGKEWFKFRALMSSVSEDYPNAEAVEKSISGVRQGAWHVYPGTLYSG